MKRLFILRHAKAVAAGPSDDDFARELAPRGHEDAAHLGVHLRAHDLRPDLALVSPARRTTETWQDVSQAFEKPPKAEFPAALYLASAATLRGELRKASPRAESVMAIGHNPGLENLALHLVRRPKGEAAKARVRAMAEGFPTCALAILAFDIESWKELDAAHGELIAYLRPKDLKD